MAKLSRAPQRYRVHHCTAVERDRRVRRVNISASKFGCSTNTWVLYAGQALLEVGADGERPDEGALRPTCGSSRVALHVRRVRRNIFRKRAFTTLLALACAGASADRGRSVRAWDRTCHAQVSCYPAGCVAEAVTGMIYSRQVPSFTKHAAWVTSSPSRRCYGPMFRRLQTLLHSLKPYI